MSLRTVLPVGTTGLIFGAIIAAWLAYLVPMYLRRDSARTSQMFDPASRFSDDVRIVRGSDAEEPDEKARVSTPLTRRAFIQSMRRAEAAAAGRRRNVIVVLLVALAAVIVVCAFGRAPWGVVAIPGGLLVAFLAIARVSVRLMHRDFDARLAAFEDWEQEETVTVTEPAPADQVRTEVAVEPVEFGMPVGKPGSLWDPLPITRPNYVSAPPIGGRTVRTIDLSAPEPVKVDNTPVVADAPEESLAPVERLRAVGE
ncbi:MAG TPA: hypothetical protein GXZ30_12610 [Propionibacterium sp.]|jgi:hypothetical protein|nr:hypothetical protein [Propionibacterium sp.]